MTVADHQLDAAQAAAVQAAQKLGPEGLGFAEAPMGAVVRMLLVDELDAQHELRLWLRSASEPCRPARFQSNQ
jgi:hypothetical protein